MYIERWDSTQGRTEIHYFKDDDEYLFGYNPLTMPEDILAKLIEWAEKS